MTQSIRGLCPFCGPADLTIHDRTTHCDDCECVVEHVGAGS